MKKLTVILLILVMAFFAGCSPKDEDSEKNSKQKEKIELVISAASSLTDVTKELAKKYNETNSGVTLTFTYGASGALQTQIEEGAPVDIFMSAGKKQMTALADKSLLVGKAKDLLINNVVLIVPKTSKVDIKSFADVGTDKVKKIAFGDPKTTPAGQYAQEVFTTLKIVDKVNEKANLGSDVRQVLTWVEMDEVDCGIVFKTDARKSDKVNIVATAPENSHKPAIYPVGIIKSSTHQAEAQKFIDFLSSDDAKALFEKSGFVMNEPKK